MSTDNAEPKSIRDSIVEAVKETADKNPDNKELQTSVAVIERNERQKEIGSSRHEPKGDDDIEAKEPKEPSADKEVTALKKEPKEDKEPAETAETRTKKPDTDETDRDTKRPKGVAGLLPKEVAAEYDNLPSATRDFITRQVKENNDLKADRGRKAYLNDVDKVLAPIMPEINELAKQHPGVTPATVVNQLLAYSAALQNPQTQAAALLQLCRDFKVPLLDIVNQVSQQETDMDALPPAVRDRLLRMEEALNGYANQQYQQQQVQSFAQKQETDKKATNTLSKWADETGAQHFEDKSVQNKMAELAYTNQAQYFDTNTNSLNLTKMYSHACTILDIDEPFRAKRSSSNGQSRHSQRTTQSNRADQKLPKDRSARASIRQALADIKSQSDQR